MKDKRYTIEIDTNGHAEKITASGSMLNELAIVFGEAAEQYRRMGAVTLERIARDRAATISHALDTAGYYN